MAREFAVHEPGGRGVKRGRDEDLSAEGPAPGDIARARAALGVVERGAEFRRAGGGAAGLIEGEWAALVAAAKNGGETGGRVAVLDPGGVDRAEGIGELGPPGEGQGGEGESQEETWF
jgi:hypothetical protein